MRYNNAPSGSSGSNNYCGLGGHTAPSGATHTQEFWEVTTGDGSVYRLGYTADAEQRTRMDGYNPAAPPPAADKGYAGSQANVVAYRWAVDLLRDVSGNTISYGYVGETSGIPGVMYAGWGLEKEQHLDWIRYTGDGYGTGAILVDVVLEPRTNQNDNGGGTLHDDGLYGEDPIWAWKPWSMWDSYRVDYLRVCANPSIQLLRRKLADEVEFVTVMTFDDLDAVREFAGEDYEAAVVPPSARAVLARFDERSQHYEIKAERS